MTLGRLLEKVAWFLVFMEEILFRQEVPASYSQGYLFFLHLSAFLIW